MRSLVYLSVLLAATILIQPACGKKSAAPGTASADGINVDMGKLYQAFANADPALKTQASDAERDFRYGLLDKSLAGLEALAKTPNLTPQQTAIVNQVVEELKQAISKAGPAR